MTVNDNNMAHILNILAKVKEDVETLASTAEIIVEEIVKGKTLNRDEGCVVQGVMGSKKTVTNEPTTAKKYQIQTLHKMPHLETVTSKENIKQNGLRNLVTRKQGVE